MNGNKMDWRPGLTVEEILASLAEAFSIVVVKVNGQPILKKHFSTFEVPDGAEVNTVEIIAGG
ncbi:sulfur carrier protein ThiS [[Eubacterium] cellulosolvens]